MSNLEKLRLEGNPVTDAVCESMKVLKHLEVVNVVGTGVSEKMNFLVEEG
jgi:hypothetical protein